MTTLSARAILAAIVVFLSLHHISGETSRLQKEPCLLVEVEKQYRDGHASTAWECVLRGVDKQGHNRIVQLIGLTDEMIRKHNCHSGTTTLWIENGVIDEVEGTLTMPTGAIVHFGTQPKTLRHQSNILSPNEEQKNSDGTDKDESARRRNLLSGDRSVLAVRVVANDFSTTFSEQELSDKIFGTGADEINLVERYDSCSYGQTTMSPYSGTTNGGAVVSADVTVGVVTVTINKSVAGKEVETVEEWVADALTDLVGDPEDQFDHVMLCLPPETESDFDSDWLGYAYTDYYLSVFNNDWCTYPSIQMHEIGHNLDLDHAGQGKEKYGDEVGMMGYSNDKDEGPIKCFNAAKSWALGWYPDRTVYVDLMMGTPTYTVKLVGIDDYQHASIDDEQVIVVLENGKKDIFINFNLATGINAGTDEVPDNVIITQQKSKNKKSKRKKNLESGDSWTLKNYQKSGRKVKIRVDTIDLQASPAYAQVSLELLN